MASGKPKIPSFEVNIVNSDVNERIYNRFVNNSRFSIGEKESNDLSLHGFPELKFFIDEEDCLTIETNNQSTQVSDKRKLNLPNGWVLEIQRIPELRRYQLTFTGTLASDEPLEQQPKAISRTFQYSLLVLLMLALATIPLWLSNVSQSPAQNDFSKRYEHVLSPGPLHDAHRNAAVECNDCHQDSFESMAIYQCLDCHNMKRHITREATGTHPLCVGCHKDHQEPSLLINEDQRLCTQCHANHSLVEAIVAEGVKVEMEHIAGFPQTHPEFTPSTPYASKKPGVNFSHQFHLNSQNVSKKNNKEALECKDCHKQNENWTSFEPIVMEENCASCHGLTLDGGQANQVTLPHGDLLGVMASLKATGAGEVDFKALHSAMDAQCATCHDVPLRPFKDLEAAYKWESSQFVQASEFGNLNFSHKRHEGDLECTSCHEGVNLSRKTTDSLLPTKEVCAQCHRSEPQTHRQIETPCASCHTFHTIEWENPYPIDWSQRKAAQ